MQYAIPIVAFFVTYISLMVWIVVDTEATQNQQCTENAATLGVKSYQYKEGICTIVTKDGKLVNF